jgi:hypothetical protein
MIPEPTNFFFDTLVARITSLERDNALMQAALDTLKPDWRKAQGTSGTMTGDEHSHGDEIEGDGWVIPLDGPVNVRRDTRVDPSTFLYKLTGEALVRGSKTGDDGYTWYRISNSPDSYVREDVVTFSKERPALPVAPALWPSPVYAYTITTRHGINGHKGIDLATGDKRPLVYSGLSKGTVVQVFRCPKCEPNGTPGQRTIHNAYGYGQHVIVRFNHADLSPKMQEQMTDYINGVGWRREHLFVMFAHLSHVAVEEGQILESSQAIGTVGSTGDSTGNHLHLEPRGSTDMNAKWGTLEHTAFDPVLIYVFED